MDEISRENKSLHARTQLLENERDKLHEDLEKLCMQKAGPEFITLATQTYFRRTAGLEQEVENLRKKMSDFAKENSEIKNELSKSNTIKSHLDQIHKLEVSKNAEIVNQLENLRGVIAEAFSDRDKALTEAEKAKENQELMRQNSNETEMRLQELSVKSIETAEQVINLQTKLEKQKHEIENYQKVINKFYKIRHHDSRGTKDEEVQVDEQLENVSLDEKCASLYDDPTESWSFVLHKESSTANYVVAFLEAIDMLRGSIDDLQSKLQMEWEIEKNLKTRVSIMEQNKILSDRHILDGISSLRKYHAQQRNHITELLDDERSFQQSVITSINQKMSKLNKVIQPPEVTNSSMPTYAQVADMSETLAQALQEKVSALILSSQKEERHIWEKNVHAAIQDTVDELQRYVKLASEEKVKALLDLAEMKQQYQQLLEKTIDETPAEVLADFGEKRNTSFGKLLRKTSISRWLTLSTEENTNTQAAVHYQLKPEGFSTDQLSNLWRENARLRNENAALKDSICSLERLTSDVSKLRLSLIQAKMKHLSSKAPLSSNRKQVDKTIREAESLKTSLISTLPLTWSGKGDASPSGYVMVNENPKQEDEKIDAVSTAGLEMVELLIMAAQIMKENKTKRNPKS